VYNQIYILRFPKDTSDQPYIYRLVKEYDIEFNILKADILLQREGLMIIELKASSKANVKAGLEYLRNLGVKTRAAGGTHSPGRWQLLSVRRLYRVCPVGALAIRRPEMAVVFDAEKCTGCGLCVPICPVRAMEVSLNDDWMIAEEFRP
jgi:L-aspartate semialdehyde sulfurtransferase ferredoxin